MKTLRYPLQYNYGVAVHPVALRQAGYVGDLLGDHLYVDVPDAFAVPDGCEIAARPYVGSWVIEVPAFYDRFDWCCPENPRQLALLSDSDGLVAALRRMADVRIRQGINLSSPALGALLDQLVNNGKLTAGEATAIRTTPPRADEIFRG